MENIYPIAEPVEITTVYYFEETDGVITGKGITTSEVTLLEGQYEVTEEEYFAHSFPAPAFELEPTTEDYLLDFDYRLSLLELGVNE